LVGVLRWVLLHSLSHRTALAHEDEGVLGEVLQDSAHSALLFCAFIVNVVEVGHVRVLLLGLFAAISGHLRPAKFGQIVIGLAQVARVQVCQELEDVTKGREHVYICILVFSAKVDAVCLLPAISLLAVKALFLHFLAWGIAVEATIEANPHATKAVEVLEGAVHHVMLSHLEVFNLLLRGIVHGLLIFHVGSFDLFGHVLCHGNFIES